MNLAVSRWVWMKLDIDMEIKDRGGNIRDWIEAWWKEVDSEECETIMIACWAIWEHRNKVTFEGAAVEPTHIVRRIHDVLQEGRLGRTNRNRDIDQGRAVGTEKDGGWQRPQNGYMKINVDAGVKEGEGVTTGVVCRDEQGVVQWGLTVARDVDWNPGTSEAVAILDGLQEAMTRGVQKVVIESDCLPVINAIKEKHKGRSSFYLLIDDIIAISYNFISIVWSFTSRVNNTVAHALAHIVPRTFGRSVWLDSLPPSASSAVSLDLSVIH